MFLHSGDGKYVDVMERALYNAVLSGVGGTTGVGMIEVYEVPAP